MKALMLRVYSLEPYLLHPLAHLAVGFLVARGLHFLHVSLLYRFLASATLGLAKELADLKYQGSFGWREFIATAIGGLF